VMRDVLFRHLPPWEQPPQATGRSFWLNGSTWEYPSFDNAEVFVKRLVRAGLIAVDLTVNSSLRGTQRELSLRSVQRHFLQATGITYRAIRQIERSQAVTKTVASPATRVPAVPFSQNPDRSMHVEMGGESNRTAWLPWATWAAALWSLLGNPTMPSLSAHHRPVAYAVDRGPHRRPTSITRTLCRCMTWAAQTRFRAMSSPTSDKAKDFAALRSWIPPRSSRGVPGLFLLL
jgi:hypothetical protein